MVDITSELIIIIHGYFINRNVYVKMSFIFYSLLINLIICILNDNIYKDGTKWVRIENDGE